MQTIEACGSQNFQ